MDKLLKYLKSNSVLVLVILVLLTCTCILGKGWHSSRLEQERYEHNYNVVTSELKAEQLKNKEYLYTIQAYEFTEQELEESLNISKKDLKDLKKRVGELQEHINILETVQLDTITTVRDSIVYVDNTISELFFKYEDAWLRLDGFSNILKKQTTISNLEIAVPVEVGVSENNTIFVKTPNPYVHISELSGAVLKTNKSRFNFTFSAGIYGGYNFISQKMYFGPGIGFGLSYTVKK